MGKFKRFSVFLECSTGSTPTVAFVKSYIDLISKMGYNELYLGCTDAYKMEGEPYFNYKRGGYTTEDFQEMDAYAKAHGIELIASIQTLAHLSFMGRHHVYRQFFDTGDILLVGDERSYAIIDKMFATISKGLSSRKIHIGFDEAFGLGLGEYLSKHGYTPKKELLYAHLQRITEIAKKYDYICEIWADMFTSNTNAGMGTGPNLAGYDVRMKEQVAKIPENVKLLAYNYNQNDKEKLTQMIAYTKKFSDNIGYAGAAWKINGFAPHNSYSIDRVIPQMEVCQNLGVDHYIICLWSDAGGLISPYAVLPTLFAASEYQKGAWTGKETVDKEKFYEIVGANYDDFTSLDYLNDPFKKNIQTMTTKSYWALFNDIFLGNYDLYLAEGNGEKYALLAEEYAKVDGGKYHYLFDLATKLAKTLSIKAELGLKIRKAYKAGDKIALKGLIKELDTMTEYFCEFVAAFETYWLNEDFVYGLEANQLIFGGQKERFDFCKRRLIAYIEKDEKIEEIESETLIPSIIPQITEDNCFELNYRLLMSFCGI